MPFYRFIHIQQQQYTMKQQYSQFNYPENNTSFDLESWQPLLDETNIFQSKINKHQIQYKTIRIPLASAAKQKNHLQRRAEIDHPFVCRLIFFSDTTLATHEYSGHVDYTLFTDRTLVATQTTWNLQLFSIILKTLIYLTNIYGPFKLSERMAFKNEKGQLKMWINEDPFENSPSYPLANSKKANQSFIELVEANNKYIANNLIGSKSLQQSYIRLNNMNIKKKAQEFPSHSMNNLKETSSTGLTIQSFAFSKNDRSDVAKRGHYYHVDSSSNQRKAEYFTNFGEEQAKYLLTNTSVSHYTLHHDKTLSNIKEDLEKEEIQSEWQFKDKEVFKMNKEITKQAIFTKETYFHTQSKKNVPNKGNQTLNERQRKSFKFYNPQKQGLFTPSTLGSKKSQHFPSYNSSFNSKHRKETNQQHINEVNYFNVYTSNDQISRHLKIDSHLVLKKTESMAPNHSHKEDRQKNVPLFIKQRHTKLIQSQNSFYNNKQPQGTEHTFVNQTLPQFHLRKNEALSKSKPKYNTALSKRDKMYSNFNLHQRKLFTDRRSSNLFTSHLKTSIVDPQYTETLVMTPNRNHSFSQPNSLFNHKASPNIIQPINTNVYLNMGNQRNATKARLIRPFSQAKQMNYQNKLPTDIPENKVPHLNQLNLTSQKKTRENSQLIVQEQMQRQIEMFKNMIGKQSSPQQSQKKINLTKSLQLQLSSIMNFSLTTQEAPQMTASPKGIQQQAKNTKELQRLKQKIIHKKRQFAELKKQAEALL